MNQQTLRGARRAGTDNRSANAAVASLPAAAERTARARVSTTATALALALALSTGVALAFAVAAEVRGRAVAEPAIGRSDASPATPDDNVAEPLIDLQQRPGIGAPATAPPALSDDQREPLIDLQRGMSDADPD